MQATRCRRFGQPAVASLFSHYMRFERNGHSFLAPRASHRGFLLWTGALVSPFCTFPGRLCLVLPTRLATRGGFCGQPRRFPGLWTHTCMPRRCASVTVSMRKMSAGKGYLYLLRSVVAGDGNRSLSSPLTRYYTEAGTPPAIGWDPASVSSGGERSRSAA